MGGKVSQTTRRPELGISVSEAETIRNGKDPQTTTRSELCVNLLTKSWAEAEASIE